MDRTIKFLLGVIAASLLMLNLQLAGVSLVSEAHAADVWPIDGPVVKEPRTTAERVGVSHEFAREHSERLWKQLVRPRALSRR